MSEPFYAEGLRFGCTRCSKCCTGEPGFVFLAKDDLIRLLAHLALDFRTFVDRYCRFVDMGEGSALCLKERRDLSCIFWSAEGCEVYAARPVQCSTYPFWSSILSSEASWKAEGRDCPGIGEGALATRSEIESALVARRAAGQILVESRKARRPELLDEDQVLGS